MGLPIGPLLAGIGLGKGYFEFPNEEWWDPDVAVALGGFPPQQPAP